MAFQRKLYRHDAFLKYYCLFLFLCVLSGTIGFVTLYFTPGTTTNNPTTFPISTKNIPQRHSKKNEEPHNLGSPISTFPENPEKSNLEKLILEQASVWEESQTTIVTILFVTFGQRNLTLNYLCHVRKLGLTKRLFVTVDSVMYDWLKQQGEPVALIESNYLKQDHIGKSLTYHSAGFINLMLERTKTGNKI